MPDDAPIWRVSVGYSATYPPGAVQSWCAACKSELDRKTLPPEFENWPEDRRERLLRAYAENPGAGTLRCPASTAGAR